MYVWFSCVTQPSISRCFLKDEMMWFSCVQCMWFSCEIRRLSDRLFLVKWDEVHSMKLLACCMKKYVSLVFLERSSSWHVSLKRTLEFFFLILLERNGPFVTFLWGWEFAYIYSSLQKNLLSSILLITQLLFIP
jgi:hypothetical protein